MTKKSQKTTYRKEDRHYLDKKHGILIQRIIVTDIQGKIEHYSLAYIDPTISTQDNGRILGYDNSHNYHHKHWFGTVEAIEFSSFEHLETKFEEEFWEIYHEHHSKK